VLIRAFQDPILEKLMRRENEHACGEFFGRILVLLVKAKADYIQIHFSMILVVEYIISVEKSLFGRQSAPHH
jgi:hypothetical protein